MKLERYWIVDGICQVCGLDGFSHGIVFGEPLWCDARELIERARE